MEGPLLRVMHEMSDMYVHCTVFCKDSSHARSLPVQDLSKSLDYKRGLGLKHKQEVDCD